VPSAWKVLGESCLSAMGSLKRDWSRVLTDGPGTRSTVSGALARPECAVALADDWPGETQHDLRDVCSAAAMVRLAELQSQCVERLHTDWEAVFSPTHDSAPEQMAASLSQEAYHRLVEGDYRRAAHILWETYMCRTVPPEAFEWIEALPVPPGDPTAHRYNRPPITQALDLYDAARRLGAEIPGWALGRLELEAEIRQRREQERRRTGKGVESMD